MNTEKVLNVLHYHTVTLYILHKLYIGLQCSDNISWVGISWTPIKII